MGEVNGVYAFLRVHDDKEEGGEGEHRAVQLRVMLLMN